MLVEHACKNGLVVLVEEIPHVESAAYELLIPGGIVTDESSHIGSCLVLADLLGRGAGGMDSRELSDAFDALGVGHGESAGHDRFSFRGTLLADKIDPALRLVSLMVKEPSLPESEIESIQSLLLQDLSSLVDHPSRRVMVALSERYYPGVWGRSNLGTEQGIRNSDAAFLRADWQRRIRPKGAVLSVAGKVRADDVIASVERYFGDWTGEALALPPFGEMPAHAAHHIDFESAQVQIALVYPSAPFGHRHFYAAKVATGVLSGGMFGRLFIEVREKRGLCYSVYARHAGTKHYGSVFAYAGTTPERAHETFLVMTKELRALKGSVTEEELARAKANLKSALIIGEESTASRAASNASDWWLGGRVRSLEEILEGVSSITAADIDTYVTDFPADSFMSMTLGPKELKLE
jgi:predicted Zn-dependent peptidase